MKIIFNLILAFFLSLTTPVVTAKAEYQADVNKGYDSYSYIVDYENSYYSLIVVEGLVDDKITYGVFFFNDVSRAYYITLVNEQTGLRQLFPETDRGDVYVLGFQVEKGSSYTILIRDKKSHEQHLPFELSFGLKTEEEIQEMYKLLMESPKLDKNNITYPISGSGKITKVEYKDNKVYINKEQYFGNVPEIAWNFYIGGYQPAQKWLKDRKGRELSSDEVDHYQKIISALFNTIKIVNEGY